MKERPIIFSGHMVRAILDGRKTQTRRVIKPQPPEPEPGCDTIEFDVGHYHPIRIDRHGEEYPADETFGMSWEDWDIPCPYGAPGDQLWVRETWGILRRHQGGVDPFYTPYYGPIIMRDSDTIADHKANEITYHKKWRPSIHMPRWASRITLEITAIRAEKVQSIGDGDAEAEGMVVTERGSLTDNFHNLWDSINAKRGFGWDTNPWVWVIEFKRLES